jgi:hypothetical protein
MTLAITKVLRLSLETTRPKSAQNSTVVNSSQRTQMAWRPETEIREMFAEVGTNVLISTRAVFYEPEKMRFGDNARVDDFCLLSGTVTTGRNVHLAAYTHVAGVRVPPCGGFSGRWLAESGPSWEPRRVLPGAREEAHDGPDE